VPDGTQAGVASFSKLDGREFAAIARRETYLSCLGVTIAIEKNVLAIDARLSASVLKILCWS
jgi:hypothetical protein